MSYLKVGEYAIALNDSRYGVTTSGWTGRVEGSCISQTDGQQRLQIRGIDYRGCQNHAFTYPVSEQFFIPYSPNLETAGFLNFIKWKGDE